MNVHLSSGPDVAEFDAVSTLLHGTYLPNWVATELNLEGAWGLEVPSQRGCLYVVIRGGGWFKPLDEGIAPIRLGPGDHLITTRGLPHRMLSELGAAAVRVDLMMAEPTRPPGPALAGGAQSGKLDLAAAMAPLTDASAGSSAVEPTVNEPTTILYGQFDLSELNQNPLDIGLPDVIHMNQQREPSLSLCLPMLAMIQSARRDRPSGWSVVVRRLSELILLQTVAVELTRRVSESAESHSGVYRMMRAATDSVVGPVLRVMVDKPEAPWTVPQMARMAKVSKSAFSDRFRRLVGLPPLQYLTEIRMGKSRRLLRDSDVEIGEIAYLVGYESPSSFSNVFKRWHGMSPIEYRRSMFNQRGPRGQRREE